MNNNYNKYLKYKQKYSELINFIGAGHITGTSKEIVAQKKEDNRKRFLRKLKQHKKSMVECPELGDQYKLLHVKYINFLDNEILYIENTNGNVNLNLSNLKQSLHELQLICDEIKLSIDVLLNFSTIERVNFLNKKSVDDFINYNEILKNKITEKLNEMCNYAKKEIIKRNKTNILNLMALFKLSDSECHSHELCNKYNRFIDNEILYLNDPDNYSLPSKINESRNALETELSRAKLLIDVPDYFMIAKLHQNGYNKMLSEALFMKHDTLKAAILEKLKK